MVSRVPVAILVFLDRVEETFTYVDDVVNRILNFPLLYVYLGVFMDNKVIKNGSEQDIQEHEDPTELLRQLLKKQRQQLADLQQSFEELEKRVDI